MDILNPSFVPSMSSIAFTTSNPTKFSMALTTTNSMPAIRSTMATVQATSMPTTLIQTVSSSATSTQTALSSAGTSLAGASSAGTSSAGTSSAGTFSANILILSTLVGALFFVSCIVAVVVCKRNRPCTKMSYRVEVKPISPTTTAGRNAAQDSPVFCDIFQFPGNEPRSETYETVEEDVREPTDVEGNSEDEYCYPENIDDHYETVNLSQASEEYNYAYDHANINSGFMNIFEDDPDSENEYNYAYDWENLGPSPKETVLSSTVLEEGYTTLDRVDDNFNDQSYQALLRENCLEEENEPVPLEYVAVL